MTSCTIPFNGRVVIQPFSHYTAQPGDFALPSHQLKDDAFLTWQDLCNDPALTGNTNCDTTPPLTAASSLSLIQQLTTTTATDIHNATHQTVTTVAVGTTVHDFVTVTGQPGQPVPTGNVNIDWFRERNMRGRANRGSGSIGPLAPTGRWTRRLSPSPWQPRNACIQGDVLEATPHTPARSARASRCRLSTPTSR